jgi:hypothetical protein
MSLRCESDVDNLASKLVASFILDMFFGKQCFTRILHPILALGATPRRIQSSLNSIVGVTRGAPWKKTKPSQPNASTSHSIILG